MHQPKFKSWLHNQSLSQGMLFHLPGAPFSQLWIKVNSIYLIELLWGFSEIKQKNLRTVPGKLLCITNYQLFRLVVEFPWPPEFFHFNQQIGILPSLNKKPVFIKGYQ